MHEISTILLLTFHSKRMSTARKMQRMLTKFCLPPASSRLLLLLALISIDKLSIVVSYNVSFFISNYFCSGHKNERMDVSICWLLIFVSFLLFFFQAPQKDKCSLITVCVTAVQGRHYRKTSCRPPRSFPITFHWQQFFCQMAAKKDFREHFLLPSRQRLLYICEFMEIYHIPKLGLNKINERRGTDLTGGRQSKM